MIRKITFIFILIVFAGCAASKKTVNVKNDKFSTLPVATENIQEVKVTQLEKKEDNAKKKALIFAKADFSGVLDKKSFVRLLLENTIDKSNRLQLQISDKAKQGDNKPKLNGPRYFFAELYPGKYKISSISMPAGSSIATEKINIDFEVIPGVVNYLGTLKIVGTKEKIKLGGVPIIKPGFDYEATVFNEDKEAQKIFLLKYPGYSGEIDVNLMIINNE